MRPGSTWEERVLFNLEISSLSWAAANLTVHGQGTSDDTGSRLHYAFT